MKNVNIEMTITTTTQEETKMKKQKIEEARIVILKELSYAEESYFYMKEQYSDKLNYLRSVKEILDRSIERIYNARVERNIEEEELGREVYWWITDLHQRSFNVDSELKKLEAAEIGETLKRDELIKETEDEILNELEFMAYCYYSEGKLGHSKLEELKIKRVLLIETLEKVYHIITDRCIEGEEFGEELKNKISIVLERESQLKEEILINLGEMYEY